MRFSSLSTGLGSCALIALFACGGGSDTSSDDTASGTAGTGGGTAGSAGKAAGGSGAAGKAGSATGGASTGGSAGQPASGQSGAAGAAGSAGGAGGKAGSSGAAGTSAGQGGASGQAGSAGKPAGAGGTATGGTSAGGAAGSAGTTSGGNAGTASDAKCTNAMPCASPDEFCNYSDNLCGASMYVGHCKLRPTGCSGLYSPVCGCDGKVYPNSCGANSGGFDLANEGKCTPPDTKLFACGPYFCDKASEYCQKIGDLPSIADAYECKTLPPVCNGVASCDCLDKTICGTFDCSDTADGGHQTTCPGP